MPQLPDIQGPNRLKPLTYDPERGKFILYDELLSGKERIVPVERLSHEDVKKLIVERNRVGPAYTIRDLNGALLTREDVVQAIESETPFGKITLDAEISYLAELLKQIAAAL